MTEICKCGHGNYSHEGYFEIERLGNCIMRKCKCKKFEAVSKEILDKLDRMEKRLGRKLTSEEIKANVKNFDISKQVVGRLNKL